MNHLNPPKSPHVTNLRDQDEDDEETVRETLRFINSATSGSNTNTTSAAAHQPRSTSMYDPTPPPPLPPTNTHLMHQMHQTHQTHQHAYETQPMTNHEKYEEHAQAAHAHNTTTTNHAHHALAAAITDNDTLIASSSAAVPNMANIPVVQNPMQSSSTSIIVMTAGVVFVLATIIPLSKVAKITARATKVAASCAPQIETIMRTALFVSLFLGSMHAVNKF